MTDDWAQPHTHAKAQTCGLVYLKSHKTNDDNPPKENTMIDGFAENEIIISYARDENVHDPQKPIVVRKSRCVTRARTLKD